MAWYSQDHSAPPALPPRPTSTYPSSEYVPQSTTPKPDHQATYSASPPSQVVHDNFQSLPYPQPQSQSSQSVPGYLWNGHANINGGPTPPPLPHPQASTSAHRPTFSPPVPSASSTPHLAIDTSLRPPTQYTQLAPVDMSSVVSSTSGSSSTTAPPSTAPFPTVESLTDDLSTLEYKSETDQLSWAQDVIRLLHRHVNPTGPTGLTPVDVPNSTTSPRLPSSLTELANRAVPIVISYTSHPASHINTLASYLRGTLLASGVCDDFLPRDPRQAFKDFETAARGGEPRGWYRLGRDYETVGDVGRAKDCFRRGQTKGDCESTYRMGMAYLLGQLDLTPDPYAAIPLLRRAYRFATIDCPQPAYVYGMLLAGELDIATEIPSTLILPPVTHETAALAVQHAQAREALERAGYLCLPQAQYKCGWMYEHAAYGCAYDPLMSVQWYSLASQGGEIEADMALSKWFLCGAEGQFVKNEKLARTFAEKAARKGHLNGSFAMGYYYELGIGGRKDTDQARKWYEKASRLGNPEAAERLRALAQPNPLFLSVQEHESRLNDTLVRRRTQAAMRSDERGDRQQPRRRRDHAYAERDREKMLIEADRAARAHRAEFGAMSPNPDMLSPRIGPGSAHTHAVVYPSRPQTTYQPFVAPQASHSMPNIGHQSLMRATSASTPTAPRVETKRYSLTDQPSDKLPSPVDGAADSPVRPGQGTGKKGPQTFAEMGFQSKPVEDEGCLIM